MLRPYRPSDHAAIQELVRSLWTLPDEREFNWAYEPDPDEDWPDIGVLEEAGQLLGYVRLDVNSFVSEDAMAWMVVNVVADQQGQGHGQALADYGRQQARAKGCRKLQTSVRQDRTRPLRFWQAQGFELKFQGGDSLRVWSAAPQGWSSTLTDEPLDHFLSRPDAPQRLGTLLNAWNRDIHDPALFGEAKAISGEDWLDTLAEVADPRFSLAGWQDGHLYGLAVLTSWQGKTDELALTLDFTCLSPEFRPAGEVALPLPLIAQAMRDAFAGGVRRIVFEQQPHFPFFNAPLAELGGEVLSKPPYLILHTLL